MQQQDGVTVLLEQFCARFPHQKGVAVVDRVAELEITVIIQLFDLSQSAQVG